MVISDQTALEAFCETYGQWKEASLVLQEHGMTFVTPNGYVQQRPEVAIGPEIQQDTNGFYECLWTYSKCQGKAWDQVGVKG